MDQLRDERFRWDQSPNPHKPLPGQLDLFGDEEAYRAPSGTELFDTGRDLPGAGERDQGIIWDVEV